MMEIHNVNLWFAPLRKRIVRFIVTAVQDCLK